MVDVTGIPVPTGASEFNVPGDLKAFADTVGDSERFSRASAASLPGSGNWLGRLLMARDTRILYECTALPGTWTKVAMADDTGEFLAVSPTDLTFGSGWAHHNGSGWSGVRLRVKNGRVVVNGAAAKGSWAALDVIATLVAKYRPISQVEGKNILVNTSGEIRAGMGGSAALSFRGEWDI